MESNCQGPMLIRVSSIWKITQNHFVGRQNHYIHRTRITTVTQMENNCQGPKIHKHNPAEIIRAHIFSKNYMTFVVSRVKQYWKRQTNPLHTQNTYNHYDTNGKQLSGPQNLQAQPCQNYKGTYFLKKLYTLRSE